jgi:ribonucleoside-diphosphate reductase beta chain
MVHRDERHLGAIQRTLAEVGPVADAVLRPPWMTGGDDEQTLFGVSVAETRSFALKALERRMKVIGLVAA